MEKFLRLITIFLTVKAIASFHCPKNDLIKCKCTETNDRRLTIFNCSDSLTNESSNNPKYFEIIFEYSKVTINCFESADLADFQYDFRPYAPRADDFFINNCTFQKDSDLSKTAKLTSAFGNIISSTNNIKMYDVLKEDPFKVFPLMHTLHLKDNVNLEVVPENIFQNHPNLLNLVFNRNSIKTFEPNTFKNLQLLQVLNLAQNKIEDIKPGTFENLISLIDLDISENHLEKLNDNIFEKLSNLKKLNLRGNKLTTISKSLLSKLKFLEELNADQNLITAIDKDAFSSLEYVKKISLSKNKISDFEHSRKEVASFWTINIFFIYSAFLNCKNLEKLDLSFNNIKHFYNDWYTLSANKLENLNLSHNAITLLKFDDFTPQTNFYIDLSHNTMEGINLQSLQDISFKAHQKLTIDVRDTSITCDCTIDELLKYMKGQWDKSLRMHVTIHTDNIKCVEPAKHKGKLLSTLNPKDLRCTIGGADNECLPTLSLETQTTFIDCSNLNLNYVPKNLIFISGFNVELNLENNNLQSFPIFEDSQSKSITKLLLSGNKITNLKRISKFLNLETLELHNNEIKELQIKDIEDLKYLEELTRITLRGNPLSCSKNFNLLKKFHKISDISEINCFSESNNLHKKYSKEALASLCYTPRAQVAQVWKNSCTNSKFDDTQIVTD